MPLKIMSMRTKKPSKCLWTLNELIHIWETITLTSGTQQRYQWMFPTVVFNVIIIIHSSKRDLRSPLSANRGSRLKILFKGRLNRSNICLHGAYDVVENSEDEVGQASEWLSYPDGWLQSILSMRAGPHLPCLTLNYQPQPSILFYCFNIHLFIFGHVGSQLWLACSVVLAHRFSCSTVRGILVPQPGI